MLCYKAQQPWAASGTCSTRARSGPRPAWSAPSWARFREHYKFQNPLSPDACWSRYLFYVWKGLA